MQQIDIHYYAKTGGEKKVIPVAYEVEQSSSDPCRQIIRCTVDLPNAELPRWLHPKRFDLLTHICDDMQVVDYSAGHNEELRTLDAEFFRYKVYSEILFRELSKIKRAPAN